MLFLCFLSFFVFLLLWCECECSCVSLVLVCALVFLLVKCLFVSLFVSHALRSGGVSDAGMVSSGAFSTLTRKHGIKIGAGCPCSVEEIALAVGEVIGHGSVKSAAHMNSAVVLFIEKIEQVNKLIETGITVNGMFEPVLPLAQPATKITLSNVPPFISDEFLVKELSRHGKVVSPIRKVPSGCKSPLLRHVVSHRRQVFYDTK